MSNFLDFKGHTQAILQTLISEKKRFVVSFFVIFVLTFSVLNTVGFVPEPIEGKTGASHEVVAAENKTPTVTLSQSENVAQILGDMVPRRITIDSVGIDVNIENPVSRDIAVLDNALLSGAVRYPGSGYLDDPTNMFIFGHSSHLPVVNNANFQAFNNLEKVKKGDIVSVFSNDAVNTYRVTTVRLVDAEEALVDLTPSGKKLTLATCNNFGSPGDRYLVEAEFVETRAR